MGTPFKPGVPAIQVLQTDLATVDRTVYLPTPTTVKLDWKEKAIRQELVSGAERIRRIGYVPVLTMAWKTYQDVNEERYPLGNANGNTLRLQDLLDICNLGGGRLRVSPGPGAGETYSVTAHGFGVGNGSTTAFQLQQASGRRESYGWQGYFNVPTTPRTNLLTYSEDLANAAWSKSNSTVTSNATTAPDGATTADKVVENTATAAHYVHQTVTAINDNAQVCFSVFVKAAERTNVVVEYNTKAGVFIDVRLDLSTNAITYAGGAPTSSGVVDYPNGWKRLWFTFNAGVGATAVKFALIVHNGSTYSYLGDGISGVYYWGAQAEAGSYPTPYIVTTSAAVTATPAYWPALGDGFDPVYSLSGTPSIYRQDWQGNQLLYSTARTNLWLYSEQIDNAAWAKTGVTISANNSVAPDGNTTGDFVNEDTSTGFHQVVQAVTQVAGTTYTCSVFIKPVGSRTKCVLELDAATVSVRFDTLTLATTILSGTATATMTALANGWFRCTVTYAAAVNGGASQKFRVENGGVVSYTGVAGNGFHVWGCQFEAGLGGSYIPTTTAAATFTDYTLSTTGLVTFSAAPLSGVFLSWTGSFTAPRKSFRGFVSKAPNLRPVGPSIATDVEIEFTGYDVFTSPTLENF